MKTDTIEKIKRAAAAHGACGKSGEATDWRSLAWLLFSPQGREFCEKNNFPTLSLWSDIKRMCDAEKYGVYIDAGFIEVSDRENVALVGHTDARLYFSRPDVAHRVMVMHGAKAVITLRDYAVVNVTRIGEDADIEIDKDDTSVVLW